MYYKLIFEDLDKVVDDELYEQLQTDEILRQRLFLDDISLFSYTIAFKSEYAIVVESDIEDKKLLVEWIDSHQTTIGVNFTPCNSKGEPISIKNIKNIEDNSFLASYLHDKGIKTSNRTGIGIEFDCPLCGKGEYKNTIFFDSFHVHAYANSCKDENHKQYYKKLQQELRKLAPKKVKESIEKDLPLWIKVSVSNNGNITKSIDTALLSDHIKKNDNILLVKDSVNATIIIFIYRDNYYKMISNDELKGYIQNFIPFELRKSKDIQEVLTLITISTEYTEWDNLNPQRYINFKNGILDLNFRQLIQHTDEILCTVQIPCNYNKDAVSTNPWWDNYLTRLTDNDIEIQSIIYQFIGLTLSNIPGYKTKTAIFLVGSHDSGKTQIQEMLTNLLTLRNIGKLNLQQLESRFGPFELLNKRLCGSGDLPYMKIPELNMFKQLTGGDSIYVEGKGKQGFAYKYTGTLLFGMNRLPKFSGDVDKRIYQRMTIIECNNSIPEDEQNPDIQEEFTKNYEYIISNAITQLYVLIDNKYKYTKCEKLKKATEDYEIENNTALEFLKTCIIYDLDLDNSKKLKFKTLYSTYKAWNEFNNNTKNHIKLKPFKQLMEKQEIDRTKRYNGYDYLYVTLNNEGLEYLPLGERIGIQ